MAFMGEGMQTTVSIGGNSMGLQGAVDQAVASLNALSVRLDEMSAQSESTGFAMSGLGAAFASSGDHLSGMVETVGQGGGILQQFDGVIDGATDGIMRMAEQAVSFISAMAGWAIIQQVISWVQQLADELFNLQVTTQRLDTGWQYLLAGGPQNGGIAASQAMMNWTSQFSLGIPFTRQDLMSSVTTLATTGLNTNQIEQFMPYLSDIAATYGSAAYGGQGVNLQQAANAVRMAVDGISRMLKYDLNITPEELIPYGLQATGSGTALHITDPNSLYRALENFAQAKGVAGASGNIVQSTWWGGWSSLQDQMQNFLLQVGGTNLNGTVNPGGFFGTLQSALDGLLNWFTSHHDQITGFASTLSQIAGGVTSVASSALSELIGWIDRLGSSSWTDNGLLGWLTGSGRQAHTQGLSGSSGLSIIQDTAQQLQNDFTTISDVLSSVFGTGTNVPYDPKHPMGHRQQLATQLGQNTQAPWLSELADALAKLSGIDLSGLGAFIQGLVNDGPSIADTFSQLADGAQKISDSMTPEETQAIDQMFQMLGSATGEAAAWNIASVAKMFLGWQAILGWLAPGMVNLGTAFSHIGTGLQDIWQWLQKLNPLWQTLGQIAQLASPFNQLATAIGNLNNALKTLTGIQLPDWFRNGMPSWLTNPFGGLPFGPSSGGSHGGSIMPNLTYMPGGWRVFGAIGSIGVGW